jgi:acetyltransferase-like isoleucine patch superfamily enzyme
MTHPVGDERDAASQGTGLSTRRALAVLKSLLSTPRRRIRKYRELGPYGRLLVWGTLTRPYWRRRFHHFGPKTLLYRPAWVYRPHQMSIGDEVIIMQSAWLEIGEPAWSTRDPVLRIGNRVSIRSHCTISAAEAVVIEDDVLIAGFVSIYDSDHTISGLWKRVTILRGADIGEQCIIGAGSVVKGRIPGHSIAVGAPARVVGSTRAAS